MKSKKLLLLLFCYLATIACKDSLKTDLEHAQKPSNLKYVTIADGRETRAIITTVPTVQTGGLTPKFELVSIKNSDGTILDNSYLESVIILGNTKVGFPIKPNDKLVDENGTPLDSIYAVNSAKNGVISISSGHKFTAGNYYFNIKVTTEADGKEYSTLFENAFELKIAPLLPGTLIYSPKNQNLVHGINNSSTVQPLMPNANPDVYFELATESDKLIIDRATGVVSLSPNYVYSGYDTLHPTIRVVSNISGEVVTFANKLTTIITNTPEEMPIETIYFFYPTLNTSVAFPTGGIGFSVQTDNPGLATRIWGSRTNSVGNSFVRPAERPAENTGQTMLETQTHNGGGQTEPTNAWMVTTTQDLTPYQHGYKLSFNYYYLPGFQNYMADGRTPTDLEVYISKDYTGGDIQDANGNWLNGTWEKVNSSIKAQRGSTSGTGWEAAFTGTPYPGDQNGLDPDSRKMPGTTFYGRWVKCSYDISSTQISSKFTVAFKVASYFQGRLLHNANALGRGGSYFLSDFHYKAVEPTR